MFIRRILAFSIFFLTIATLIICQNQNPKDTEVWEPEPSVVTPGNVASQPPSDAIVLFDGGNLNSWVHSDGGSAEWDLEDDHVIVKKGAGGIQTKQAFGSIQLHLEWRTPAVVEGESQGRGNSGLFLQERYEVQILDSYDNRTYSNGQAGSIYKQAIPLANPMRGPGQWQTYDIIYHAPSFSDDTTYESHPHVTVIHNGVLIQNHTKILGTTEYIGPPKVQAHEKAAIFLQDHGNPVAFRNIWVRELD
ncbi:MAG: DUF1080 domain-containing protein [Saprospiraceae bacterium]|nr:DUF1080 domain-containing protein [Saprospiraceae bacterium]